MQSTVNERLKILVNALGTNPGALSKMLGISPSTLRNYIDRDSKPGYEVLEKLYNSFKHINLPWLFGDPGEPLLMGMAGTTNSTTITANKNKGNVQNNTGNNGTVTNNVTLSDCQRELEAMKRDVASYQREIELLKGQLEDKNEIIILLRGGYNRPN